MLPSLRLYAFNGRSCNGRTLISDSYSSVHSRYTGGGSGHGQAMLSFKTGSLSADGASEIARPEPGWVRKTTTKRLSSQLRSAT